MAFFKFRKGGDDHTPPSSSAVPESVEAMRKRARHRLIGAAVLVLAGVVGFPMLFDNQPRPISVDLPIHIPDRNTVKPLGNLPVGNAATSAASGQMIDEAAEPKAPVAAPAPTPAASRTAAGSLGVVVPAVVNKPAVKAPEKPADKPVAAQARADNGVKAQALLDGKESFVAVPPPTAVARIAASAPAAGGRFVVQVGAFSEGGKAQEVRAKLEAVGLKTYTQVVTPKEGKRIRVRIGPFESKADADKAAAKVKKLDLPAAILEL